MSRCPRARRHTTDSLTTSALPRMAAPRAASRAESLGRISGENPAGGASVDSRGVIRLNDTKDRQDRDFAARPCRCATPLTAPHDRVPGAEKPAMSRRTQINPPGALRGYPENRKMRSTSNRGADAASNWEWKPDVTFEAIGFVANRSMATALQRVDATANRLSHADRIELNVSSANLLSEPTEIFESWRRCLLNYRVDAGDFSAPHIVTQNELKVFREPLENIHVHAQEEIDRLYAVLRQHGYVVLLCNRQGLAIYHRGDETKAIEFKHWGIWV